MFPETYQDELLARMGGHKGAKGFLTALSTVLTPELFEPVNGRREVAAEVLARWKKSGRVLTKGQMTQLCHRHGLKLDPAVVGSDTWDFDLDEVQLYARDRVFRDALVKANVLAEQGRHDEACELIWASRTEFPSDGQVKATDWLRETKSLPKRAGMVATGVAKLDEAFHGGPAPSDLACVIGPTSSGKSAWLCWIAAQALLQKKKVHYFTLELDEREVAIRIQSCLLGRKPTLPAWKTMAGKLARRGGRLRIQEAPSGSLSATAVEKGIDDDCNMVIVDYPDHMMLPSYGSAGETYHGLGRIYSALNGLAMDRDMVVWVASQVNREGYGEDKLIDLNSIEASLRKAMLANQIISLNVRRDDPTHVTLYVVKNTHGPRYQEIPVTVDWALGRFEEGRWTE